MSEDTTLTIHDVRCDTGPGWDKLITELTEVLDLLLGDAGWYPVQIKEKFGGLRFYVGFGDPNESHEFTVKENLAQKIIDRYESASLRICELCGEYATETKVWRAYPSFGGWVRTLCPVDGAKALIKNEEETAARIAEMKIEREAKKEAEDASGS